MAPHKTSNWRPKAIKSESVHVEEVGGEVLVYNLEGHRVHCLNGPAACIWSLCNGKRTVNEIASELEDGLTPVARELIVRNAVLNFSRLGLVETPTHSPTLISRRDMTRRLGIGSLVGIALPLVTSIMAPTPANAVTCRPVGAACTANSQCCSNKCNPGHDMCQ